jgi:hypothetical protein
MATAQPVVMYQQQMVTVPVQQQFVVAGGQPGVVYQQVPMQVFQPVVMRPAPVIVYLDLTKTSPIPERFTKFVSFHLLFFIFLNIGLLTTLLYLQSGSMLCFLLWRF